MEQVYRIGIDHGYGNIKTAHHILNLALSRGKGHQNWQE